MAERTPQELQKASEGRLNNRLAALEARQERDNNPALHGVEVAYQTSATPGDDDPVTHGLGRVPKGFHVVKKDAAVDVYQSPAIRWTADKIFVRATVGGVKTTLFIF